MGKPTKRPLHLLGWIGVAVVIAVLAARFPRQLGFGVMPMLVGYLSYHLFSRYKAARGRPRFSLRAILLLVGLVACGLTFMQEREPWQKVHSFPGYCPNIAMSPDGSLVAVSEGASIEIREAQTGKHRRTLELPAAEVNPMRSQRWTYSMAFSEDNATLLIAGWRKDVHLYDWEADASLRSWPGGFLSSISRSGDRFATFSRKGDGAEVYEAGGQAPLMTVPARQMISPLRLNLSATGAYVAVHTGDRALEIWHVDSQTKRLEIENSSMELLTAPSSFSPNEELVAVATRSGLEIWNLPEAKKLGAWRPQGFDSLRSLTWSPDGTRLLVSFIERTTPSTPAIAADNVVKHCFLLNQTGGEIAEVVGSSGTFSPSGDRIATVFGPCRILDGHTGELLHSIWDSRPCPSLHGYPDVAYSPDGDWLLTSGDAAVYKKTRSEWWYSLLTLPSYWGLVGFAVMLFREAVGSEATPNDNEAAQ